jgi:leader peptidase (prepilin peptidase)/N-methyltransferase
VIPDAITVPGVIFAVAGATYSGELQIVHIWIDWNNEQFPTGPYIPAWLDQHRHLHGLAWSLTGLVAGAGITWCVRVVSSLLLGQESLGFGDVTLMAMIGAFVGWQPVVLIFLLAPFCGLLVVAVVRLSSGRTYVPYGPFLSAAAVVVLFAWKWLWHPMRYIFGHAPSLILLGVAALVALVVLLGLLRLYRTIPVTRRSTSPRSDEVEPQL